MILLLRAEEGDKDEKIKELFKMGKKGKNNEKSPVEIALLVNKIMAELEVIAEEDAELNTQGKPVINKLKKLSSYKGSLKEVASARIFRPRSANSVKELA